MTLTLSKSRHINGIVRKRRDKNKFLNKTK
ncbi:hypothetical protein BE28_0044 [Staphylococcus phage vB_SepS_BE28]|nr:hypothetical protein BE28_0044 [Staphylococcus phage vB_SepS_BE28]DAI80446.1 MAG TPA: hypothetical protein [Caudoviricetes sp.]DAL34214.1 MAG TPA_asm: hypothetical protein [Caudoviricetes sp.]DAV80671.1 MAG TPA: hypothetical protein [Caudoviricetes sp.]